MGISPWLTANTFELLNALGIVGGLLFTAHSLRSETKTRRVANLLALTEAHRSIWREQLHGPHLARVLAPTVDVAKEPITREEEIFVNLVIQHLSVVFFTPCGMNCSSSRKACAAMSPHFSPSPFRKRFGNG